MTFPQLHHQPPSPPLLTPRPLLLGLVAAAALDALSPPEPVCVLLPRGMGPLCPWPPKPSSARRFGRAWRHVPRPSRSRSRGVGFSRGRTPLEHLTWGVWHAPPASPAPTARQSRWPQLLPRPHEELQVPSLPKVHLLQFMSSSCRASICKQSSACLLSYLR